MLLLDRPIDPELLLASPSEPARSPASSLTSSSSRTLRIGSPAAESALSSLLDRERDPMVTAEIHAAQSG